MASASKDQTIVLLGQDARLAHQSLFKHRHPNVTPEFHNAIIDLWHSDSPRVLIQAFRGAAKSSIAEEAIIIQACYRRFKNGIILGETYERAVERLRAIKHEFEQNEFLEELFGRQVGDTWTEGKIILKNGVIIQAFGRGQSLRGSKHYDCRPDRAFLDDIENEESVATPEAIDKTMRWVMSVVMPALDPGAVIRLNGTPLHPRSVICQLAVQPDWVSRVYPIERITEDGRRESIWPDRFPMKYIYDKILSYTRLGLTQQWAQEYLCKAEDPATKPFTADMYRVEPTVRTWQACYAMVDPARTVKAKSAMTGVAVWSWIGNRLIVWDAFGGFWRPDEIVRRIFEVDETYKPVVIGVEKDGLEEFILQPLRQEQVRRGCAVPIRDMRAPKGKINFVSAMQPFFKAGEVVFAKDCNDARSQLLSFPTGRIDIPNALAYALTLRPGQPVYDNFGALHVEEDLPALAVALSFLAVNSDGRCTTAVLLQLRDGQLRVLADWVREGEPGASLGGILKEAGVVAGGRVRAYAPPEHFGSYDTIGMRAAARSIPVELHRGGGVSAGREELRGLLARTVKTRPALAVASSARWTLNALAGGYAREITKGGILTDEPVMGPYRVLMEGVESFASLMKSSIMNEDDPPNYAWTPEGRRYLSSRPDHGGAVHSRR
jgi:hypothetical protein